MHVAVCCLLRVGACSLSVAAVWCKVLLHGVFCCSLYAMCCVLLVACCGLIVAMCCLLIVHCLSLYDGVGGLLVVVRCLVLCGV